MIRVGELGWLSRDFKILTFKWESRSFLIQLLEETENPVANRTLIPLAISFINRGYYPYTKWVVPNSSDGVVVYNSRHPYRARSVNFVDFNHERWRIVYEEDASYYYLVKSDFADMDARDRITMDCIMEPIGLRNKRAYTLKQGYHSKKLIWGIVTRIREKVNGNSVEYQSLPSGAHVTWPDKTIWVTIQDPQYFTEFELPSKFVECNA